MIDAARAAFLAWCRNERDINQRIVERLTSGAMRTGSNDGNGWQDTSAESLANSRRIIADMDALIPKIEADIAETT